MSQQKTKSKLSLEPLSMDTQDSLPEQHIRRANLSDVPKLVVLGLETLGSTPYEDHTRPDTNRIRENFEKYIIMDVTEGMVLVAVNNGEVVGGIAGAVFQPLWTNSRGVLELFMFVDPEHRGTRLGKDLMDAYEYWAEHVARADFIQYPYFPDVHPEGIKKLYNRRGFTELEQTFYKKLRD